MIRRFVLLFILILTACNPEAPATDSVFVTATANLIFEPPAPAQSIAGTDIPAEFSGGNPQILAHQSPFEFTVTGDLSAEVSTGSIVYNFIAATGAIVAHDQVYLAASDASSSQQVSFQFYSGILAGEYPIVTAQTPVLGRVAAQYGYLADDGLGTELRIYADDISGTFTVISVGDTLSGEFQFTAHRTDTDGTIRQVEITGSFGKVPYNRSADPFEIAIPLPTRALTGTDAP